MPKKFNNDPSLTNWELVSVHPKEKNWSWLTIFNLWANSIQTVIGFSLIASLYVAYGLNGTIVFFGTIFAGLLALIFANLTGKPCQEMGIPFPVFLRVSMGIYGAKFASSVRGLVALSMFGIQTFFISKSIGFLIRILIFKIEKNLLQNEILNQFIIGLNLIDWASLILATLFQFFLFTSGIKLIKKIINFSSIITYIIIFILTIFVFLKTEVYLIREIQSLFSFNLNINFETFLQIFTIFGTIFAYFSIILVNFGDYSRYISNKKELRKGNLSLLLNIIIFSILAIIITIGCDIIFNQKLINIEKILTNPTDIIGQFDQINLSVLVLVSILIASISTNLIANFIPANNTIINFLPKSFSVKSSGFLICIIGFIVGSLWISLISKIGMLSIIDTMGAFLGPLFGILIIDYYIIKKQRVSFQDLFSSDPNGKYFYSKGWNIKSFYSLFIAFVFSSATIWNIELRFLNSYSWIIGASVGGLMQYLFSKK